MWEKHINFFPQRSIVGFKGTLFSIYRTNEPIIDGVRTLKVKEGKENLIKYPASFCTACVFLINLKSRYKINYVFRKFYTRELNGKPQNKN